eukprot:jgi/Bigna1/139597/aug1.51_g14305
MGFPWIFMDSHGLSWIFIDFSPSVEVACNPLICVGVLKEQFSSPPPDIEIPAKHKLPADDVDDANEAEAKAKAENSWMELGLQIFTEDASSSQ